MNSTPPPGPSTQAQNQTEDLTQAEAAHGFTLYVLIPYRASGVQSFRKEQLERLIPYLRDYFHKREINDYRFIVIEQNDDRPFNRGCLLNIGFLECVKNHSLPTTAYFAHQNTDLFPISVDYSFVDGFRDCYGFELGVGGIAVHDMDSFYKCNGFPNQLFGWGGDDSAILARIRRMKIPLYRSKYEEVLREETHVTDSSHNGKNIALVANECLEDRWKQNGLSNCTYEVISRKEENDVTTILVTLP